MNMCPRRDLNPRPDFSEGGGITRFPTDPVREPFGASGKPISTTPLLRFSAALSEPELQGHAHC